MTVGFESFFTLVKSDIKSKEDVIVAAFHWFLIQNGYQCIGIGEEFSNSNQKGSELLPNGWNANHFAYTIQYVKEDKTRVVCKTVKVNDALYLSVSFISGQQSTQLDLTPQQIHEFVTDDYSSFQNAFKNNSTEKLFKLFSSNLLKKTDHKSILSEKPESRKPTRQQIEPEGGIPGGYASPNWKDIGQYPEPVGRADLDPFHRGIGGGMLFDDRNFPRPRPGPGGVPGHLPPGSVPPGARFDPFGPINPGGPGNRPGGGRFGRPDPDHMKPPDGYDDMFS